MSGRKITFINLFSFSFYFFLFQEFQSSHSGQSLWLTARASDSWWNFLAGKHDGWRNHDLLDEAERLHQKMQEYNVLFVVVSKVIFKIVTMMLTGFPVIRVVTGEDNSITLIQVQNYVKQSSVCKSKMKLEMVQKMQLYFCTSIDWFFAYFIQEQVRSEKLSETKLLSWHIPVSIATEDEPNFSTHLPKFWIPQGTALAEFKADTSKWIVVNPDATGTINYFLKYFSPPSRLSVMCYMCAENPVNHVFLALSWFMGFTFLARENDKYLCCSLFIFMNCVCVYVDKRIF